MCWTTLLVHKCNLPSCPTHSQSFKEVVTIAPCYHRKQLSTHVNWPKGCSLCVGKKEKTKEHRSPLDHRTVEERALVTRRAICPSCKETEGISELQISKVQFDGRYEILQPRDLAKIFCCIIKIPNARTIAIAGAIADALEDIRLQQGLAPHAFTTACIYAASHIAPCPKPLSIDWLAATFNMKSRLWLLHAYTSLFNYRHLIIEAGVFDHSAILLAMPKACCHYPQTRHCPRRKNAWGFDEDRCTGKQIEGLHVLGGYVGFRDFLHDEGVPVNDPKEAYYRESDLELLRKERTKEQLEAVAAIVPH